MDSFNVTRREQTPEEAAEIRAFEARIAGYRPEPPTLSLSVGERFRGFLRAIPFDKRGRPLPWRGNVMGKTEDPAVARQEQGQIVAIAPVWLIVRF